MRFDLIPEEARTTAVRVDHQHQGRPSMFAYEVDLDFRWRSLCGEDTWFHRSVLTHTADYLDALDTPEAWFLGATRHSYPWTLRGFAKVATRPTRQRLFTRQVWMQAAHSQPRPSFDVLWGNFLLVRYMTHDEEPLPETPLALTRAVIDSIPWTPQEAQVAFSAAPDALARAGVFAYLTDALASLR